MNDKCTIIFGNDNKKLELKQREVRNLSLMFLAQITHINRIILQYDSLTKNKYGIMWGKKLVRHETEEELFSSLFHEQEKVIYNIYRLCEEIIMNRMGFEFMKYDGTFLTFKEFISHEDVLCTFYLRPTWKIMPIDYKLFRPIDEESSTLTAIKEIKENENPSQKSIFNFSEPIDKESSAVTEIKENYLFKFGNQCQSLQPEARKITHKISLEPVNIGLENANSKNQSTETTNTASLIKTSALNNESDSNNNENIEKVIETQRTDMIIFDYDTLLRTPTMSMKQCIINWGLQDKIFAIHSLVYKMILLKKDELKAHIKKERYIDIKLEYWRQRIFVEFLARINDRKYENVKMVHFDTVKKEIVNVKCGYVKKETVSDSANEQYLKYYATRRAKLTENCNKNIMELAAQYKKEGKYNVIIISNYKDRFEDVISKDKIRCCSLKEYIK